MAILQLVPTNTNFNFVRFRYVSFLLSLFVIVASLVGFQYRGLNYGIDFKGGYILEVQLQEAPNLPDLREKFAQLNLGEVSLQEFGSGKNLLIRIESQKDGSSQDQVLEKIKKPLGDGVEYRRVETVGPKVGGELVRNGVIAVALSMMAMLIYIGFRFEWQFAVCAIIALAHDCIAILGLYSFTPLEFNETAIIAVLVTAGYSINDTIVIFDRIRENMRKFKRMSMEEIMNKSINETLSRTTMTSLTTLLSLFALYIWGGAVISAFSLPIITGIMVGTFSSVCLAAPLLLYLNVKRGGFLKGEPEGL
jgi:preprotein translocase subunit SecF